MMSTLVNDERLIPCQKAGVVFSKSAAPLRGRTVDLSVPLCDCSYVELSWRVTAECSTYWANRAEKVEVISIHLNTYIVCIQAFLQWFCSKQKSNRQKPHSYLTSYHTSHCITYRIVSHITYHMSHVTYHMSRITYHILHITYHVSYITYHISHITYHISRITYYIQPSGDSRTLQTHPDKTLTIE